jgi:hypothetical protein
MRIWTSIDDYNLKVQKSALLIKNEDKYNKSINDKENIKKLLMNSNMLTSSKDNTLVLWMFIIQNITNQEFTNSSSKPSIGNSYFLQPVPLRNFHFSSPPSKGICFGLKNDISDGLNNEMYQINIILDGRVVTVVKNEKKNLFCVDKRLMSDSGVDAHNNIGDFKYIYIYFYINTFIYIYMYMYIYIPS